MTGIVCRQSVFAFDTACLPFVVVLFRPELDQWKPGEHNCPLRGNNFAFVTGKAVIDTYW